MEFTMTEIKKYDAGGATRFYAYLELPYMKKPRGIQGGSPYEVEENAAYFLEFEAKRRGNIKSYRLENKIRQAGRNAMVAQGLKVGDIFYSSWGYDQTNIDFYQVTKILGKMAEITPIRGSEVEGARYEPGSYSSVVPAPGAFSGKPERHLIKASHDGEVYFHLNSFSSARRYEGKPLQYSWGH